MPASAGVLTRSADPVDRSRPSCLLWIRLLPSAPCMCAILRPVPRAPPTRGTRVPPERSACSRARTGSSSPATSGIAGGSVELSFLLLRRLPRLVASVAAHQKLCSPSSSPWQHHDVQGWQVAAWRGPAPHAPRLRAKSPPITARPAATLADLASSGWTSPGQAGLWTLPALAAACEQVYGPGTCNAGRLPHSPA